MPVPGSIAVLGGGLTGLSAAFHLSRRFPTTAITLINKETRFGGWVRSERVKAGHQDAEVLLEAGPRTLRPNARSVLELIHLLDLTPSLLTVPKSAPAAKNRFLYIHGSQGIHRIPSSPLEAISSLLAPNAHLGRTLLSSLLREPLKQRNRPLGIDDESVDDFFTRRFGAEFARLFGSALVHGIYAADSRKLSLRATFPSMWDAEERGRGSALLGFLRAPTPSQLTENTSYDLGDLQGKMRDVSVFTFKDGMGTLVNALVSYLRKQPNVHMYSGVRIMSLRLNSRNNRFEVTTSSQETLLPTHVVSALPLPELRQVLSPATPLPHLTTNTYSSVTVVNLVFGLSPSSLPLHPDGFGYLVPRPRDGYAANSGSGILGCVFDSSSTAAQDTPGLVKMTVMLGGPYICGSVSPPQVDVPNLLSELAHQLGRPLPSPLFVKVHSNTRCIPLYAVGHLQRMEELKRTLASEPWNGRLEVVGAGVLGVSVGDCVEAGRSVGRTWG
ncbi:hypothetical protein EV363DRAFT_1156281 [Boletus edulis]|nr:hypothetical protein EV363DRAFT_1156281 [Boletus edulis]